MTPILAAALELQQFLDEHSWKRYVIGGIAVPCWGEPRFTGHSS